MPTVSQQNFPIRGFDNHSKDLNLCFLGKKTISIILDQVLFCDHLTFSSKRHKEAQRCWHLIFYLNLVSKLATMLKLLLSRDGKVLINWASFPNQTSTIWGWVTPLVSQAYLVLAFELLWKWHVHYWEELASLPTSRFGLNVALAQL